MCASARVCVSVCIVVAAAAAVSVVVVVAAAAAEFAKDSQKRRISIESVLPKQRAEAQNGPLKRVEGHNEVRGRARRRRRTL